MSTASQIAANQKNAKLSTGPTSSDGKAKVSHNALKTGLTGRTVLLPSDDVSAYQAHTDRVFRQWAPETDEEKRLAQSLVDTLWRLERIPSLEAGIYAIGRRELASRFTDEQDEAVRKSMIEAQIFLTYRRDLNNLSIQEARLRRIFEKDEAELKRLITERRKAADDRRHEENMRWASAIHHMKVAKEMGLPFDPQEVGFEFSVEEIIARDQQRSLQGAIGSGRYYEWKKRGLLNRPQTEPRA